MSAGAKIRGFLIIAGATAGTALAVMGIVTPVGEPDEPAPAVRSSPIVLNTATPPLAEQVLLAKPLSLESTFGVSELTGGAIRTVHASPLAELNIDRRWDVVLDLKPPKPGADLAQAEAKDQVKEPKSDAAVLEAVYEFRDLPPEARARAAEGLDLLKKGTELLRNGEREFRQSGEAGAIGRAKIVEAANTLRNARDKLEAALRIVPDDRALLNLMRETKANLYFCMKLGM